MNKRLMAILVFFTLAISPILNAAVNKQQPSKNDLKAQIRKQSDNQVWNLKDVNTIDIRTWS